MAIRGTTTTGIQHLLPESNHPVFTKPSLYLSLTHTAAGAGIAKKNKQLAHPSKFELAAASAGPINALLQFFSLLLLLLLPLVPSLLLVSAMPQLLLLLQLFCNAFTGLQKKKTLWACLLFSLFPSVVAVLCNFAGPARLTAASMLTAAATYPPYCKN